MRQDGSVSSGRRKSDEDKQRIIMNIFPFFQFVRGGAAFTKLMNT